MEWHHSPLLEEHYEKHVYEMSIKMLLRMLFVIFRRICLKKTHWNLWGSHFSLPTWKGRRLFYFHLALHKATASLSDTLTWPLTSASLLNLALVLSLTHYVVLLTVPKVLHFAIYIYIYWPKENEVKEVYLLSRNKQWILNPNRYDFRMVPFYHIYIYLLPLLYK